jgi:hypothetical protein
MRMQLSTRLMFLGCALGLALGGCARTSPDRARTETPDEREPETIDPVIDWVGNPERLKPSPGAEQPALEVQDIGNPGGRVDQEVQAPPNQPRVPNVPDNTTGPNRNNPGVPPPSDE